MNTILKTAKPSDLVHVSNVRAKFPPAEQYVSGRDSSLDELVQSVRTFGVMQPITVKPHAGKLAIVYGHRRAYAAQIAKLPAVPVLIQDVPAEEIVARQLIENIQRQDLALVDQAEGVRKLYEEHGVTALVAEMLGKSATWVSKMLCLTAPGKSRHAQHLLKCDRLHDLELAYLLCQLEALDTGAANEAAHAIFHGLRAVTRDELRTKIKQAQARQAPVDEDDDDESAPTPAPKKPAGVTVTLSAAQLATLRELLDERIRSMPATSVPVPLMELRAKL